MLTQVSEKFFQKRRERAQPDHILVVPFTQSSGLRWICFGGRSHFRGRTKIKRGLAAPLFLRPSRGHPHRRKRSALTLMPAAQLLLPPTSVENGQHRQLQPTSLFLAHTTTSNNIHHLGLSIQLKTNIANSASSMN